VTGLIFGAAPAAQGAAVTVGEFLKEGGRTGSTGTRGRRVRSAIAVVQIAVALVLLIGAGLLVRSYRVMTNVDLGFDPRNILVLRIDLPGAKYPEGTQVTSFYTELSSRLRALPGVNSVGLGSSVLLSRLPQSATLSVQGRPPQDRSVRNTPVPYDSITPDFFRTLRIPLIRGRVFTDADGATSPRVVIVNQSLVRRFFPDGNAIGKNVTFDNPTDPSARWLTIVGVVGDTRRGGVDHAPWGEVYYPLAQAPDWRMYALIRTSGDPLALVRSAHAQVWAIDRNQPVHSTRTADALLAESQANRRFTTLLVGLFSILALALAAIGIYGVVAYSTAQRTQEIGIRMALGARRADVLAMVVKEAGTIGVAGLAIGIAVAFALTRFMSGLLFGVSARDPITFLALSIGLLVVTAAATLIPAARAVRVNPVVALRAE